MNDLLLGFYGDDFTGSTDALDALSRAGVTARLFMEPPSRERLLAYPQLQAVGIAGRSRSLHVDQVRDELLPVFQAFRDLQVPHMHYKVCSTFDSSPTIGSIGRVIELAMEQFRGPFVPLLVAAPALGRYCVFGNLFARMGIGSEGAVHRLDRHPSMSQHPTTPADESDLRLHLSKQTDVPIGLMDILTHELPMVRARELLYKLIADGAKVVLFDAIDSYQLGRIGQLIDEYTRPGATLFSVGSSGVDTALTEWWCSQGRIASGSTWDDVGASESLLVGCGSCSPVTMAQIEWAVSDGYGEVALDTLALVQGGGTRAREIERAADEAKSVLASQVGVIVHTYRGDGDERRTDTERHLQQCHAEGRALPGPIASLLGRALGETLRRVVEQTGVRRICLAGGDTSSYAARAMGIDSLQMAAPLVAGAPLCRAEASILALDGAMINFKGGQVGPPEYFDFVRRGTV
ncbi:MAG: four-carbon acid sugar kinase family protein [Pirellulaceae bacterium]|nr:four-carbon acid sugar kinase family protein [Planctomycetales bacterium]